MSAPNSNKFMDKHILVTGAKGFIGKHFVNTLKSRYSDFYSDVVSLAANITKREKILNMSDSFDIVYHLAGITQNKIHEPMDYFNTNSLGTANILELCKQNNIPYFIHCSSTDVYSTPPHYLPINEHHPTVPTSPYALSKLLSEVFCTNYREPYTSSPPSVPLSSVIILRIAYVQGVGQPSSRVVPELISSARKWSDLVINGSGDSFFDFIDIDDVVDALLIVSFNLLAINSLLNVASGVPTTLNNLASVVKDLLNPNINITHTNASSPPSTVFDISRIRSLGFEPKCSIRDSIEKQI